MITTTTQTSLLSPPDHQEDWQTCPDVQSIYDAFTGLAADSPSAVRLRARPESADIRNHPDRSGPLSPESKPGQRSVLMLHISGTNSPKSCGPAATLLCLPFIKSNNDFVSPHRARLHPMKQSELEGFHFCEGHRTCRPRRRPSPGQT